MLPFAELAPVDPKRLQAVAEWVETHVRPVLHVVAGERQEGDPPQQEFEARDYQIEAWARLDISREEGKTRALGNLATGLGKTFVAAVDVMRYRGWCAAQDPPMYPRILYVSHQRDINEQAAKTFRAVMPDAEVAFFQTRQEQLPDVDITFANIQGLYSELDRFDPQDFEYIIWDESHHLEAETYKAVRDHFDPLFEHAITATVERADGKDIQDYFGTPLYQKSLPEGIAEGHLADVDYHIVFDKAIRDRLEGGFNPKTLQEIKDLFKEKPPSDAIARNIEEEIARLGLEDPKTIVFCDSIDEAEEMAELLDGVAYHSQTDDRAQALGDFRTGRRRRITTRDMFNEGVDIPDAELIIFLRSTNSPTIFEQQLGRGLRKAPGKDKVYVLDFVANVERIAKVREISQAIQKCTRQTEQQAGAEGSLPGEQEGDGGLHVHTAHGDFDFDSIAVDLLDKWKAIPRKWETPPSIINSDFVKLDNDQIVALAREIKSSGPLTQDEIDQLSRRKLFLSASTINKRFGSLSVFQEACKGKTREEEQQELIALAMMLSPGEPLSHVRIEELRKNRQFPSISTVKKFFGSLTDFQKACGFDVGERMENPHSASGREELVELALSISPDRPLQKREIEALSAEGRFAGAKKIRTLFGSIAEFQKACGFGADNRKETIQLTNNDVIARALELSPSAPLKRTQIRQLSSSGAFPSLSNVLKRFGTLAEFHQACGFTSD